MFYLFVVVDRCGLLEGSCGGCPRFRSCCRSSSTTRPGGFTCVAVPEDGWNRRPTTKRITSFCVLPPGGTASAAAGHKHLTTNKTKNHSHSSVDRKDSVSPAVTASFLIGRCVQNPVAISSKNSLHAYAAVRTFVIFESERVDECVRVRERG